LKGRLSTAEGQLSSADVEQKTQRETIMRLLNDQQNVSQCHLQLDNLRVVRTVVIIQMIMIRHMQQSGLAIAYWRTVYSFTRLMTEEAYHTIIWQLVTS